MKWHKKKTRYAIIWKHIFIKKKKRIYIENPSAVVRVKWFIRHILTFIRDLFFQTGKHKRKILVPVFRHSVLYTYTLSFHFLQVILYPTSNSSKSAELHRMIVPKNSQDSDLKIKLAVRMDKPPHMKHSGWVYAWRFFFFCWIIEFHFNIYLFCQFTERVSMSGFHMEFPPKMAYTC